MVKILAVAQFEGGVYPTFLSGRIEIPFRINSVQHLARWFLFLVQPGNTNSALRLFCLRSNNL